MTDRAVAYVTDRDFLVPTIVSAVQVRDQVVPEGLAEVLLFLVGLPDDEVDQVSRILARLGLRAGRIPDLTLPPDTKFRKNHVTPASLARLCLPGILDSRFRHIVYLDGDTQIVGDIRPLVRHCVRPGYIAAAQNSGWMSFEREKLFPASYLNGIGVRSLRSYFNAGVLACTRETLDEMFPRALAFFLSHSEHCRYHDQSALNAVFADRQEVLSPAYNFHTEYTHFDLQDDARIAILHFTGAPKPWLYEAGPWGDRFLPGYRKLVQANPELLPYLPVPDSTRAATLAHQHRRKHLQYRRRLNRPLWLWRRAMFLGQMRSSRFAF